MIDYSITNIIDTAWSLLLTKISFPGARLVRRPVYVRGRKGITYGKGLTTGVGCRIDASSRKKTLKIGNDARFGDYVHINADESVKIGDNILTASKVFISDTSHGIYKGDVQDSPETNPSTRRTITNPVEIGDNVWIGENVVILPGTKVGDGCVIGANAVLNGGTYEENSMIVGAPGRVVKRFNKDSMKWEKVAD